MASVLVRASCLVAATAALALTYVRLPEAGARTERPLCERCNVVLISFDTVRADHLGAYGYERPTSPNVDALAKDSVVFTNAISQSPWTLPSHGSMLSGLYPSRLGVLRYPASRLLPDVHTTLPEVFRAAGYATAGFVGGGFVSKHYGFDRGFDRYVSMGRRFGSNVSATLGWLDDNRGKPFFLFFHGYDAHRPYYSRTIDKAEMGLPPGADSEQGRFCLKNDRERPSDERLEEVIRYYDAAIHHGDRGIGQLFRALRQMNLMNDTVILITSDHGEEFFEHGNCDHVRFVYRESVHVPYILYIPRYSPGGRKIDGLMPASISVSRTLLDVVGIDHAMPGVTLMPMLEGRMKEFPVVYSEAASSVGSLGSRGNTLAITKGNTKLISFTDEGTDEAYDLAEDPFEQEILREGHSAYYLRQSLRTWAAGQEPLPRPERGPKLPTEVPYGEEEEGSGEDDGAAGSAGPGAGSAGAEGGAGSDAAGATESVGSGAAKPESGAAGAARPAPTVIAPVAEGGPPATKGKAKGQRRLRPGHAAEKAKGAGSSEDDEEDRTGAPPELLENLRSLGYLE